jgi:hypothetical protein
MITILSWVVSCIIRNRTKLLKWLWVIFFIIILAWFLWMRLILRAFFYKAVVIHNSLVMFWAIVSIWLWIRCVQYLRNLIALKCIILLMSCYICVRNIFSMVYLWAIHHIWNVLNLFVLFVVLFVCILPLLVILLIVIILICWLIFSISFWIAYFILIILILLWYKCCVFISIFLFDYLIHVLNVWLHNAYFINI